MMWPLNTNPAMALRHLTQFSEQMEKLLKSLNLPSKAQLEGVGERLDRIEENIERLTVAMGRTGASPPAPAPKRTRKPEAPAA